MKMLRWLVISRVNMQNKKVLMHPFIWIELNFECSNTGLIVPLLDYSFFALENMMKKSQLLDAKNDIFFCPREYDEQIPNI